MKWPLKTLDEIFQIARGGSPRPIDQFITDDPTGYNWIMIGDTVEGSKYISSTKKRIKREGLKKSRMVYSGDFLLTNSMSFGRPYILKLDGCIHDGWLVLSPRDGNVHPDFFYYLLGSGNLYNEFTRRAAGAVVKNLNSDLVRGVQIPLPPLAEQKRIAGILDAADALRAKRRESLAQLDALLQATFLDMFGDPVTNPKGWELKSLPDVANKFTDGPFGSNLKSSHYKPSGVRVIRLQNIGVGEMLNDDIAYISQEHYESLPRQHCQPGDLVIGTLGDPNLRACIIPESLKDSLNKADCILMRCAADKAINTYVCRLLNCPSTVSKALELVRGQTRGRISMGRLKELLLPIPPLDLQRRFASIVESVEAQKARMRAHLEELDALFASLQARAFNGEL